MMNHEITSIAGHDKRRKRVGKGIGSGHGKTSTRGTKGAGSRSGCKARLGYEGGQVPLYRRLPKRGFNNFNFTTRYEVINVSQLDGFAEGTVVDVKCLYCAGLIRSADSRVKLLGDGELTKKLDVNVHRFSKTAHDKILSCGGVAKVVA